MFRRKKEFEDEDALWTTWEDEEELEKKLRKKKQTRFLLSAALAIFLLCAGLALWRVFAKRDAVVEDDAAIAVSRGFSFIRYSSSGRLLGQYDLNGRLQNDKDNPPPVFKASVWDNFPAALSALSYPVGAFYDEAGGQLIVFGEPAPVGGNAHAGADFLTALRAVYSSQDPAVSIDPIGSETTQAVRYYGQTESTHFGWVMFEADRLMKTLSMGQDNVTGQPVFAQVPGFANIFELELRAGLNRQQEARRRFWFTVPEVLIEESADGRGMAISALRLAVETEYLDENWQTLPNPPPDPAGEAFASHISARYQDYASEFPVLNELEAIARWTALAHWLKQAEIPIQPELWLVNPPPLYETPQTTPAITATKQETQNNLVRVIRLWGGVDLSMNIKTQQAGAAAQAILKRAAEHFQAWLLPARVKTFSGLAPIAPNGVARDFMPEMELPFAQVPRFVYAGGNWEMSLPRLRKLGEGEQAVVLLEENSPLPLVLTYEGYDEQGKTFVFANRAAGVWMKEFSDAYQIFKGEFTSDGAFSYNPDQFILFDAQGRVLQDSFSGAEYEYQSGDLMRIRGGEEIVFEWNADHTLRRASSGGKEVRFAYQDGRLTEISGAAARKFVYDGKGRVYQELDALGNLVNMARYDSQGRLLLQVQNGRAFLYDWSLDGALQVYTGDALFPWRDASEADLEDLRIALGLAATGEIDNLFFARRVKDRIVIFANGNSYSAPAALSQNPKRLRSKLSELAKELNAPGKMTLASASGLEGVAFRPLFPEALAVDAQRMDKTRILRNLEILRRAPAFSLSSARVINAVPFPEQLQEVGLNDPAEYWRDLETQGQPAWKTSIDEAVRQGGFSLADEVSSQSIVAALTQQEQVIFVVAHYGELELRLPGNGGSSFKLSNLTNAEKQAIADNHPLVILLSCDAAAPKEGISFAQQLLEIGPSMVVAPNGKLPVKDVPKILQAYSFWSKSGTSAWQAFQQAIYSVYHDWLIPDEDGVERFFEFLIRHPVFLKRS